MSKDHREREDQAADQDRWDHKDQWDLQDPPVTVVHQDHQDLREKEEIQAKTAAQVRLDQQEPLATMEARDHVVNPVQQVLPDLPVPQVNRERGVLQEPQV